jgi:hypothetical protein
VAETFDFFRLGVSATEPVYTVDLVKSDCRHDWRETVWDLRVDGGQVFFTCARCGLPPSYALMEFAQEYLYSPGVLARVRLGPVEEHSSGRWDSPETEQAAISGVQAWMALDLHMALGLPVDPTATNQGHASWADWWAELCGSVRLATKSRDDALRVAVAKIRAEALLIADDAPRVHQWMTFGMKTAADSIDPDWDAIHPATTEASDA